MTWFNTKSWLPDLLIDKRSLTQASQQHYHGRHADREGALDIEPVEPVQRASVHVEHEPGTIAWLYQDYGGES